MSERHGLVNERFEAVLARIETATGRPCRRNGDTAQCHCPAHDDKNPSLSVGVGDNGAVVLRCHAGCRTEVVLKAIGLTWSDLHADSPRASRAIAATYDYADADGRLLFQVVRFNPKSFKQRRPDGHGGWVWNINNVRRPLYCLPELLTADKSDWVFVPEGEKDVDGLRVLGLVATCNPGGAGKWGRLADDSALHGRRVAIIADADAAGRKHAEDVACRLYGKATELRVFEMSEGRKDATDWIESRDSLGPDDLSRALVEMAESAPVWTQKTAENAEHCRPPLSEAEVRRITQNVGRYSVNVDPNTFPLTETGNAEFDVALYGEGLRYDHRRRRWLTWAQDWWMYDQDNAVTRLAIDAARQRHHAAVNIEDGETRDRAAKWARRSESANVMANSLALAAALKPIADAGDCWDSDPFLLGVQNGVVDLRTGEVRSGQPEDRITKVAAVEYDQRATCPLWIQFLRRIMDGNSEMIAFLQRLGGYCLTADIREQILPIFWGQGSNGKSVFCETLLGILGPYASEAPPGLLTLTKYEDHPTEIADLQSKRVIFASETERNARLRIQLVKRLTGDRYLKGRFMRCDYFLFERTHKTILRTNNAPCVAENTVAVWRRLRLVPFRVTIPPEEEDRELASKLRAEWPGILNWLLTGCIEWQRGGLGEPPEVTQATADYRAEQDRLTDFWETRCVFQPDTFTSRADLYAAYSAWAEKAREAPMDRATLFEEVRRLSGITEYRQRQAGQIQRGFRGIGVLP